MEFYFIFSFFFGWLLLLWCGVAEIARYTDGERESFRGDFTQKVQPEVFGNGELMLEGDGMSVCVLRCVGGTFGRVYYSGIRLKERR